MKQFLVVLLMTIIALAGAEAVLADTTPDRTRAVVTRSTDAVERPDRGRDSEAVVEETEDDNDSEDGEGSGVTLEVTYSNQGGVEINFETSGDPGEANISVSINGQSVSGTGGQNNGGNTSNDGVDGQDGADGSSSEEEEVEDETDETEEPDTSDRTDNRPSRDLDERFGVDRDRR